MTKSARIQEGVVEFLADGCPHTVQEIKSFLQQVGISDYSEGQFSGSINTLLRNQSIKKIDRGIYKINQNFGGKTFMKTCFVVSPIGDVGSEIRINADKLFKYIISPVCKSCGFEPVRVDQINDSDSITQTIIDKLLSSELVIADISGHNPNVSYWTTSDESCSDIPSSEREFTLAKALKQELETLGLTNILLTDHCYVYAKLPATPGMENCKSIGFIAHMDTAPDFSGKDVKPQIIPDYDGGDILLKGSQDVLKVSDFPSLASLKGRTLITTDGTTLLGADDKAGVAEIMTAVEELIAEGTPHGELWIGFTPDEEVGAGADLFDLAIFQADYAYTVDGDYEGEVAYENFNAASAIFHIKGVNVHPGEAKDIMVNAALVGCEIVSRLPEAETPAHTSGREGFYHLTDMSGDVASATLSFIIRDHDKTTFEKRLQNLRDVAQSMNQKYGPETVTLDIEHSYENMLSVIEDKMEIVDLAKQAIASEGLTPLSRPIRGGTDGARLSFMGLPCPNLGTGGYGFHGPYEHISVEGMQTAVRILKNIATHPIRK